MQLLPTKIIFWITSEMVVNRAVQLVMYVIGAVAASAERCQDNPNAVFSSAVSIDCG